MRPSAGYSHVTLSVTDLDASVEFYERVLGLERAGERSGPTWRRVVLRSGGLLLGLTTHVGDRPSDRFDERRVGLDHLSIACADASEIGAWAGHLDELLVPRGEIVEAGYATVLVVRDPDGIPIEFFAPAT